MLAIVVLLLFVVLACWVAAMDRSGGETAGPSARGRFGRTDVDAEEIGVLLQAL
jgi:hypothetical protein